MSSIDESARRRFETARLEGDEDPLERFLPDADDPRFEATLCELLCIEREVQWKRHAAGGAEPPPIDSILEAHDALGAEGRSTVLAEESLLVERFGSTGTPPTRTAGLASTQILTGGSEPGWTMREDRTAPTDGSAGPALRPGARVGRYKVRRLIGRGGFAQVWAAWDEQLRREVALKISRADAPVDPDTLERIRREAQSAARLQHPAIVPVYEVGTHLGCPFIVSRLLPGPDLASKARKRRMAFEDAARWTARLGHAVDYAHQCGIVHRDIKPANVLLDEDGEPTLTDFGLARQDDAEVSMTQEGDLLGTPAYMSPEQARGSKEEVGPSSDVYALGVLLYELVCGRRPFEDPVAARVLHSVLYDEPPAPRKVRSEVPRDLETVILCAIAKEPERRYASAGRLAEDLERFLEHRPVEARRRGAVGVLALWCRRNPALATSLLLGLVTTVAVGLWGLSGILDERARFRVERDRATDSLYRSRVDEAEARIAARETGWRAKALASLDAAASSVSEDRDPVELRTLAALCLGIPKPSFDLVATWYVQDGAPTSLDWSADSRFVAEGTIAGTVRLRDPATGAVRAVLEGPEDRIYDVACHPSAPFVIAGAGDGSLTLWDISEVAAADAGPTTVDAAKTVNLRRWAITNVAWSPDGSRVAATLGRVSGPPVRYRPAVLFRFESEELPDGARSIGEPDDLPPYLFDQRPLAGHERDGTTVVFSADGTRVATGGLEAVLSVWDTASGERVDSFRTADPPRSALPHGDGWIVTTRENFGALELRPNGRPRARQRTGLHAGAASEILRLPQGWLVSCGDDGALRCWTSSFSPLGEGVADAGPLYHMACSQDGKVIVVSGRDVILKWRVDAPVGTDAYATHHTATFVPGSRTLATTRGLRTYAPDGSGTFRPYRVDPLSDVVLSEAHGCVYRVGAQGRLRWSPTRSDGAPAGGSIATDEGMGILRVAPGPGDRVAVVLGDGRVALREGGKLRVVEGVDDAQDVDWSRAGALVVVRRDRVERITKEGTKVLLEQEFAGGRIEVWRDLAALAGGGDEVIVLDLEKERIEKRLPLRAAAAATWRADGRVLAAVSDEGPIRLWDPSTWAERATVDILEIARPTWLALDPDGDFVASGGGGWTMVHDLVADQTIAQLPAFATVAGAFLSDGSNLSVGSSGGSLLRWSRAILESEADRIRGAAELGTAAAPGRPQPDAREGRGGHRTVIWGTAASPDGKVIATTSDDGEVKIWDATTGLLSHGHRHKYLAWCASFSSDSSYLLTGSVEAAVWDVAGRRRVASSPTGNLMFGIACHPSEPMAVMARKDGQVEIWHFLGEEPPRVLKPPGGVTRQIAFSPDGGEMSVAWGADGVLVWDLESPAWAEWVDGTSDVAPAPTVVDQHGGSVAAVAYSDDGRWFASGDARGHVILNDRRSGERWVTLRARTRKIRVLSFSSDSELLSVGAYDSQSVTWNLPRLTALFEELGI